MIMGLKDKPRQITKNKNIVQSVCHAIVGICKLVKEESNFRSDLFIILGTTIVGCLLKIEINQWLWLIAAFFSVIGAEVVNSIVENIVDLVVGPKYSDLAKRAKDISAGGVLLSALFAFIIGLLIFIPAIIQIIN